MATPAEIDDLIHDELDRYEAKLLEHAEKGKKPFRLDAHSGGIVPQEYFDTLRAPDDPDYLAMPRVRRTRKGVSHAQ